MAVKESQNSMKNGAEAKQEAQMSVSKSRWILLPEQIDTLIKKPYAYNATSGSILEVLFLQKFWMAVAKYIPSQITPCVLTCLGLAVNVGSCLILLCYCPDAKGEAPSWVYAIGCVGLFLYQTLDAVDGKQAIKVQDTQIEELYDHGCDANSMVFITLSTMIVYQLGNTPMLMFLYFIASMLAFYSAHWQDHVTHVMIFGKIDVSEGQFLLMGVNLLTACFGTKLWQYQLFFGMELRIFMAIVTLLPMIGTILVNMGYILGNKTKIDDYVKVPRKKGIETLFPGIPVAVLTFFAMEFYRCGIFHTNPSIFVIAIGLAYAKLTVKLVIANITYSDMDLWDSILSATLLLYLNAFLPSLLMLPAATSLLCYLVYSVMDEARYFTYVSWDLSEVLDVHIFTLKYPPGHPNSHKGGNEGVYVNGLNDKEILNSMAPSTKPHSNIKK